MHICNYVHAQMPNYVSVILAYPTYVGGSGGNPEDKAMTGLLRMLALLPMKNRVREERARMQLPFRMNTAPAFELAMPAVPRPYRQVS